MQRERLVDLSQDASEETADTGARKRHKSSSPPQPCECQPFYLLASEPPPSTDNRRCLSMRDVIANDDSHPIESIVLFNYLVDIDWLLDEIPLISSVPCSILHGAHHDLLSESYMDAFPLLTLAKVQVSIPYGTHHSKLGFIFYEHGMRLFIGTNNLIPVDNIFKTQGIYVQDFPLKASVSEKKPSTCDFEQELIAYLKEIKVDKSSASQHLATANLQSLIEQVKLYDFSAAEVVLIASVPGHHSGPNLKRWGHMRLRNILERHPLPPHFAQDCPLVLQVSSIGNAIRQHLLIYLILPLGSMGPEERYLEELISSLCPTTAISSAKPPVQLVWPTVDCIRESAQVLDMHSL